MMLIESEPSEKQLLKANSITTKLIANSTADNLMSANYHHLQLYNQTINDKKMNSISQYQLNTNPFFNNQTNLTRSFNQNGSILNHHGTIRPHNQTATTHLNGGLTLQNQNIISNYATISRAHNQLNGGIGHFNASLLNTQVPNSQPHLNSLHSTQLYQQLTPLSNQINHLNQFQFANGGLYAPQFVGLEVGLDFNNQNRCCCCFNKRCNISRVSCFLGWIIIFLIFYKQEIA